jgi:hypothetical protein
MQCRFGSDLADAGQAICADRDEIARSNNILPRSCTANGRAKGEDLTLAV